MVNQQDEQPSGPSGAATPPAEPRSGPLPEVSEAADASSGPTTDQLRISAIQAVVAAGLAPSTGRQLEPEAVSEAAPPPLPDWTDPPTGQVPRVLLDHQPPEEAAAGPAVRGPSWREAAQDWDDDLDLSFLVDEEEDARQAGLIAGRGPDTGEVRPFEFGFEGLDLGPAPARRPGRERPERVHRDRPERERGERERPAPDPRDHRVQLLVEAPDLAIAEPSLEPGQLAEEEAAWAALLAEEVGVHPDGSEEERLEGLRTLTGRRRSGAHRRGRRGEPAPGSTAGRGEEAPPETGRLRGAPPSPAGRRAPVPPPHGRNAVVATITGLAFGLAALACFLLGSVATLALVAVALTVAAGEAYGTLRGAGRRPATPLGLLAVAALVVGAYLYGTVAVPAVLAGLVVVGVGWYLATGLGQPGERRPGAALDLATTVLVAAWVGVLGSFAGLLLAPARFPHRHGVAFVVGLVAVTVAHDVGCYAVGAKLGRHRLAPRVSPNKTWEGIAGGTALAFLVAGLVVTRVHPFDLATALALAAAVAVLGPLGDLAESLLKRDLGVKDMGRLLPEHGGVFDRVDAMLFVLPAAYLLFRLVHLS